VATRSIPGSLFTDSFIRGLKPESKQYEIVEPGRTGLRLRVGPGGTKSFCWIVKDKVSGKLRRVSLGSYGEVSLQEARQRLDLERTRHRNGLPVGIDPEAPKTVKDLSKLFFEKRIEPHRNRPDIVKQVIDHDINPAIGGVKLQAVTTPVLAGVVDRMVARGAESHAGKAVQYLKMMFSFAESRGYLPHNPAASLRKKDLGVVERERVRWLTSQEIGAVWETLDAETRLSPQVRYGLKLLLAVGVRTDELRLARWDQLDLDGPEPLWRIPKENTKTGAAWEVPLSDLAVELLKGLKKDTPKSVWVMPGKDPKKPITDKILARAVARLLEAEKLRMPRWVPHDMRRTMRTHLSDLKVAPHVAEKCLNHSLGAIAQIYDQHTYLDERREALQLWANRLRAALGGEHG